jgi:hypothetical protein
MKKMIKNTSAKPLMLNFTSPKPMTVVKETDCAILYDPIKQITYFMGGGGSSNGSRSEIKTNRTQNGWIGSGSGRRATYQPDHEYGSDD